jgi:alkylated DNA repair dioxygenase AlkB
MSTALQPDLFAQGTVELGDGLARATRVELDATSWVDVVPRWLRGADQLFGVLERETAWETHQRWMYERWVDEPRCHGPVPSLALASRGLASVVAEMPALLGSFYGVEFDAGALALYRDGNDSVAWHGDSIGVNRAKALVAVLSLGATRRFRLRPRGGGSSQVWSVHSGDLVVMGGACQRDWEHSVPKMRSVGPRISLQFRSPGWVR